MIWINPEYKDNLLKYCATTVFGYRIVPTYVEAVVMTKEEYENNLKNAAHDAWHDGSNAVASTGLFTHLFADYWSNQK